MDLAIAKKFDERDAQQILEQARPLLNLPSDAELHLDEISHTARGARICFSYTQSVPLQDGNLGEIAGVCVQVTSHGELRFNARGKLITTNVEPADPGQLHAIGDHLSKMVANGQVYFAKRGEVIDPEQLRQAGKSWYVQEDENGNKHLVRAWIA